MSSERTMAYQYVYPSSCVGKNNTRVSGPTPRAACHRTRRKVETHHHGLSRHAQSSRSPQEHRHHPDADPDGRRRGSLVLHQALTAGAVPHVVGVETEISSGFHARRVPSRESPHPSRPQANCQEWSVPTCSYRNQTDRPASPRKSPNYGGSSAWEQSSSAGSSCSPSSAGSDTAGTPGVSHRLQPHPAFKTSWRVDTCPTANARLLRSL